MSKDGDALRGIRSPGYPPTTDEAAKKACVEVARMIAGPRAYPWFTRYLEEQISYLAAHRVADEGRLKKALKRRLRTFSDLLISVEEGLGDPILITLLGEHKYRAENEYIHQILIDTSLVITEDALSSIRGPSLYEEIIDLRRRLKDFLTYAEFAINLPELSGPGRRRVYLRETVSPKQLCAAIIIVARRHFQGTLKSDRKAFDCAEIFWRGSQTALGPKVTIKPELPQYANDPIRRWRRYFEARRRKDHFALFEDCHIRLLARKFFL